MSIPLLFTVACIATGCSSPVYRLLGPVPDAEVEGIYHEVRQGETLISICRGYGADLQEVAEINGIEDPSSIRVGDRVFIPDAAAPRSPTHSEAHAQETRDEVFIQRFPGEFIWPVDGVVTSRFGIRWGKRHDGIDIAAPEGTPVLAAAAGTVLFAGSEGGYGKLIILQHEKNMITIYAHNRELVVRESETVRQGQKIAEVGQTGRATGPHVHFEIREGRTPRNPLFFLPKKD
ncbi:MAG: peptidoglycan DD-metalloendopeptidase family protein [Myxococcales bacterium]|nr:peptidoglycan DD-metalloendopeptidase family protein [Myxococcales bacterium]